VQKKLEEIQKANEHLLNRVENQRTKSKESIKTGGG
jgi:hypothetical protein